MDTSIDMKMNTCPPGIENSHMHMRCAHDALVSVVRNLAGAHHVLEDLLERIAIKLDGDLHRRRVVR